MVCWPRALLLLAFLSPLLLASPVSASDSIILQRAAGPLYVYAESHSHAADSALALLGCPTFCPIPETKTVIRIEVWKETNGCPGLQRGVTLCLGGEPTPADEKVTDAVASTP